MTSARIRIAGHPHNGWTWVMAGITDTPVMTVHNPALTAPSDRPAHNLAATLRAWNGHYRAPCPCGRIISWNAYSGRPGPCRCQRK